MIDDVEIVIVHDIDHPGDLERKEPLGGQKHGYCFYESVQVVDMRYNIVCCYQSRLTSPNSFHRFRSKVLVKGGYPLFRSSDGEVVGGLYSQDSSASLFEGLKQGTVVTPYVNH